MIDRVTQLKSYSEYNILLRDTLVRRVRCGMEAGIHALHRFIVFARGWGIFCRHFEDV